MAKRETLAQMRKELAKIKAEIEKDTPPSSTSGFARVIGFRNDKNSDKYGTEYSYLEFVDSNNCAIGSPRGDEEAMGVLKQIKAIRFGASKRGKARFDKGAGAWSIQTEFVPSFVVMGTKNSKGVFKARK